MRKHLLAFLLVMISGQTFANSCLLVPTAKQPWDDIFCMENVGVSKKDFYDLCELLTFNDGSRTVKKVESCPSQSVARCSLNLSYTNGSIIQYFYSKKDFSDQLRNLYKDQCENSELGKGKWLP